MLESFSRAFTPMRTEITATEVKVTPKLPAPPTIAPPPKAEVSEKDVSKTFKDGEAITTSPLKGQAVAGSVSITQSGSKYYLKEKVGTSLFIGSASSKISTQQQTKSISIGFHFCQNEKKL
jgi:hypothetical protein